MTTDDFETAARARAATDYAVDWEEPPRFADTDRQDAEHFLAGAEWARDHLAAQEPTDAEVEAAAREIVKRVFLLSEERPWEDPGVVGEWKPVARAALAAAKEARHGD